MQTHIDLNKLALVIIQGRTTVASGFAYRPAPPHAPLALPDWSPVVAASAPELKTCSTTVLKDEHRGHWIPRKCH